ncbi:Omp85 family outer membrane protein [Leptospira sp. 'Mane']|uniref:Omp85 family outer membrane protein n=1 Tax=Leptospira sp. 'Mane' TaxID=3387407 RepID=UPI00398B3029
MLKYITRSVILLLFLLSLGIYAQPKTDDETGPRAPHKDLPFEISEQKRLSVRDVKNKKEGGYFTGLPLINSDPNVGVGYGARVIYLNNGGRDNPLFEYTPYRYRIFAQYFNTTKNAPYHWLSLDAPYVFDTKWRVRADLVYDRNPNTLYFGIGEKTLQPLSYLERNDPAGRMVRNAPFSDYETNLGYRRPGDVGAGEAPYVTDSRYNRYDIENPNFSFSGEYSFFGGTVRTVTGVRLSKQIVRTYDGKTYDAKFGASEQLGGVPLGSGFLDNVVGDHLPTPEGETRLTRDQKDGKILGFNGGTTNTVRAGIVYDTRDFEPDPNRGLFLEATHERSAKAIGSNYNFNKNLVSGRLFFSPVEWFTKKPPELLEKFVIATRAALMQTNGDAPFYEYRNMWGTETNQSGLGGRTTIRGYKQDRFVGQTMGYANFEIRWKFASADIAGQHFDFQLVPFYDVGRVWDASENVNLKGYKHSRGIGFRIPWNQATVIYVDYAVSKEDRQAFVNFNHIF